MYFTGRGKKSWERQSGAMVFYARERSSSVASSRIGRERSISVGAIVGGPGVSNIGRHFPEAVIPTMQFAG